MDDDWAEAVADEDVLAVGRKVTEMADRVKTMDAVCPGAQAVWYFELDDIRFKVMVAVIPSTASDNQPGQGA